METTQLPAYLLSWLLAFTTTTTTGGIQRIEPRDIESDPVCGLCSLPSASPREAELEPAKLFLRPAGAMTSAKYHFVFSLTRWLSSRRQPEVRADRSDGR